MAPSKDMEPFSSPFFPNIFFKNQFCSKPVWPPKDTNLVGKVAIVSGSNQGLGFEASDQLLALGLSRLIIAVRSVTKGEVAADKFRAKYPAATIDVFQLDMVSYDSIQAFVAQVEKLARVDVVILNAGVRKTKLELVPGTGHEESLQVNYISTVLLCILLLPILKKRKSAALDAGPGRISIVGSGLAFQTRFLNRDASPLLPSFDEAQYFSPLEQYNVTKLLGMMFLYKITDYVSADDVVVNIVDPGFVKDTSLSRELSFVVSTLMAAWKQVAARSVKVGASSYVDAAAVKGKESHGCFIMSWEPAPFAGLLYTPEGKQIIERLWQETMAELSFAGVQGILDSMKTT